MKTFLLRLIFPIALALLAAAPSPAADLAGNAAAVAAQQEAEERFKRLTATIEETQATQAAQQQKLAALSAELNKLREEIAKANNNAATTESLKRLADQITEVDKKRVADNERVLAELTKLAKAISATPPVRPHTPETPVTPPTVPNGEGFDYLIENGNTLGAIVQAYRDKGIKITSKSVMDANPTVNWNKLKIGQKIFIPKPK